MARQVPEFSGGAATLPLAGGELVPIYQDGQLKYTPSNSLGLGDGGEQGAAQLLELIKTVDGASSGLDADLIQGVNGSLFLQKLALAIGTLTEAPGALNLGGVTVGHVLTFNGTDWAPAAPTAASVNVNQWEIAARLASGNGTVSGIDDADLTEEAAPDPDTSFLLAWVVGELRKIKIGNMPLPAGSIVTDSFDPSVYATEAEARAGIENTKFITSLRLAQGIETLGSPALESIEVAANHSVTPFTVTSTRAKLQFFTHAGNALGEFPAGLSVNSYGVFRAALGNNLTFEAAAGSGVTINGAVEGFAWEVPAKGTVMWWVIAPNTIWLFGDYGGPIEVEGEVTFKSNVRHEGSSSGAGGVKEDRAGTALTLDDCNKLIVTTGALTIPNGQRGDGRYIGPIVVNGDHNLTFNGLLLDWSTNGVTVFPYSIYVWVTSASTLFVFGPHGTWTESKFV